MPRNEAGLPGPKLCGSSHVTGMESGVGQRQLESHPEPGELEQTLEDIQTLCYMLHGQGN